MQALGRRHNVEIGGRVLPVGGLYVPPECRASTLREAYDNNQGEACTAWGSLLRNQNGVKFRNKSTTKAHPKKKGNEASGLVRRDEMK